MKKVILSIAILLSSILSFAQVGIGTLSPDPSAQLDIKSVNKGLLIPRVALTGTADNTTIASPATSLLVYNTATAGSGATAVSPGFYYWSGTAWVSQLSSSSSLNTWSLSGNSGINPATSFIGTTDNVALKFRVNNMPSGEINPVTGNTSFGLSTLFSNTTGSDNTAHGMNALYNNTTGSANTASGRNALYSNTTGNHNTASGRDVLYNNKTGSDNTASGWSALFSNTTGSDNMANGLDALYSNTTGSSNTASGRNTLFSNTTGNHNTASGRDALYNNTTGIENTANGKNALFSNTSGNSSTATGLNALYSNTTGIQNTAHGRDALYNNTTGDNNTAIGQSALFSNATGAFNTAVGFSANTTENNLRNATAIGANSKVGCSNCMVLGNGANVGIGTSKPKAQLHIQGYDSSNILLGLWTYAPYVGMSLNGSLNQGNYNILSSSKDKNLFINRPDGYDIKFRMDNVDQAILLANGNMGIGTTVPDKKLTVTGSDTGFIASFVNTNGDNGDGIQIKLGKTHPAYNGSDWLHIPNPIAQLYAPPSLQIRNWVLGHQQFDWHQLLSLYPNALLAGTGFQIANVVIDQINAKTPDLSIVSKRILNRTKIFDGLDLGLLGSIPKLYIPELNTPQVDVHLPIIPSLPEVIPQAAGSMVPTISFNDANNNSLSNKNQFISFVDKDNRELGSIRAESVTDWQNNYLSTDFFTKFTMSLIGLDFVNSISWAGSYFTDMTSSYNNLGVEYVSGHGDYAEWLERSNSKEPITQGDIVGVKGGKITRDLLNAEQIRVVSSNPIMLGNAPEKNRESKGNKIAFMGQVPVKVIGSVKSGDYIVAKTDLAGYGKAVSAENLSVEDLKLAVGRAWETNTNVGAKTVNTLVGIDKADYVKVLEGLEMKVSSLEDKFNQLSAQLQHSAMKNGRRKK